MKKSLGLIETQGLAAGIEAADAAVKSANVELIGYELTKGGGWTTIKVQGDVGAVKAAVDAARMAAAKVNQVISTRVIPRPSAGLDMLVYSPDTVGTAQPSKEPDKPKPPTPPKGSKKVKEEEKLPAESDEQKEENTVPEPEQTNGINNQEEISVSGTPADNSEETDSEGKETPAETEEKEKASGSEESAKDSKEAAQDDAAEPVKEQDTASEQEEPVKEQDTASEQEEPAKDSKEAAQEGKQPETEEGEAVPEQEVSEPAASKPAKRTGAAKGRKGKRGSKQENTD